MSISEAEVAALLEKDKESDRSATVRPYDFTQQRINRTELPMLEIISKTFGERMGISLTNLLGRDASVHFQSLETVKCGDLQASLPVPGIIAIVRLKPLAGCACVSVEPALLLALLDGFFGGSGRPTADSQACIAPAAQRFLSLLLKSVAPDLAAAWAEVTPVELELLKLETNPRMLQLGAAHEPVNVVRFTVEFGARSGRIEWLFPESMFESIRDALRGEKHETPVRKQAPWPPQLAAALQDAPLDAHAVLAEARISLGELMRLLPGDIIPIDPPQQVTLFAGTVPLYRGRFGNSQGRNAVKIQSGASS